MSTTPPVIRPDSRSADDVLAGGFRAIRTFSEALAASLSDADATIQSMADASPAKWHLAHTTWFFETFVLRDHVSDWQRLHQDWAFLFNSYYEAEGRRLSRAARGMLSRPGLHDILAWRAAVDEGILQALPAMSPTARELVKLGCQHEQQHQELLLADILHAFSINPLEPALWPSTRPCRHLLQGADLARTAGSKDIMACAKSVMMDRTRMLLLSTAKAPAIPRCSRLMPWPIAW
jgi:hypothetical protein